MSTFGDKSYNAKSYLQYRPEYPQSLYKYIREYSGLKDGEKAPIVLDLACGPGEATAALARTVGESVYGVDPSEVMLAQAQENLKSFGSRVHLLIGSDETLTSQFAESSVDIVNIAEAAHWMAYPDLWETVHAILKPGGTLSILAYLNFYIEGYPETIEVCRDLVFDQDKFMPYWSPGHEHLRNLYADLEPPSTMFTDIRRIVDTAETPNPQTPMRIRRENITIGDLANLVRTFSAYHTWKAKNPDAKDVVDEAAERLMSMTGLSMDAKITATWETVLICAKKATNEGGNGLIQV